MAYALFQKWHDSRENIYLMGLLFLILGLILFGLYVNLPQEQGKLNIFLIMILLPAFAVLGSVFMPDSKITNAFAGFGDSRSTFLKAFAVGAALYALLLFRYLSLSLPFSLGEMGIISVLYVKFFSPILEEVFFRGFLIWTLKEMLVGLKVDDKNGVLPALIAAAAFALFHFSVYGASPFAILSAFVFGMIGAVGNSYFKSIGFSIGAHFTNNLLVGG